MSRRRQHQRRRRRGPVRSQLPVAHVESSTTTPATADLAAPRPKPMRIGWPFVVTGVVGAIGARGWGDSDLDAMMLTLALAGAFPALVLGGFLVARRPVQVRRWAWGVALLPPAVAGAAMGAGGRWHDVVAGLLVTPIAVLVGGLAGTLLALLVGLPVVLLAKGFAMMAKTPVEASAAEADPGAVALTSERAKDIATLDDLYRFLDAVPRGTPSRRRIGGCLSWAAACVVALWLSPTLAHLSVAPGQDVGRGSTLRLIIGTEHDLLVEHPALLVLARVCLLVLLSPVVGLQMLWAGNRPDGK